MTNYEAFEHIFKQLEKLVEMMRQDPELAAQVSLMLETQEFLDSLRAMLKRFLDAIETAIAEGKLTDETLIEKYKKLREKFDNL